MNHSETFKLKSATPTVGCLDDHEEAITAVSWYRARRPKKDGGIALPSIFCVVLKSLPGMTPP